MTKQKVLIGIGIVIIVLILVGVLTIAIVSSGLFIESDISVDPDAKLCLVTGTGVLQYTPTNPAETEISIKQVRFESNYDVTQRSSCKLKSIIPTADIELVPEAYDPVTKEWNAGVSCNTHLTLFDNEQSITWYFVLPDRTKVTTRIHAFVSTESLLGDQEYEDLQEYVVEVDC